jgi:hypothetical protein
MQKLLVTFALGASMLASAAIAQDDQSGHHGRMMQDMTRAQAQQQADAMFQRIDLNHDGVITRAEAEQAAQQYGGGAKLERMIERVFGSAQSVTLQQFEAQQLARFDRDDLNHDGIVTGAERQQARAALKAARAGQGEEAPQPQH